MFGRKKKTSDGDHFFDDVKKSMHEGLRAMRTHKNPLFREVQQAADDDGSMIMTPMMRDTMILSLLRDIREELIAARPERIAHTAKAGVDLKIKSAKVEVGNVRIPSLSGKGFVTWPSKAHRLRAELEQTIINADEHMANLAEARHDLQALLDKEK